MSAGKGFLESIVGCNALTDLDLGIAISIYSFSGLMRKLPNLRSMAVQVQLWIKGNYKKEFAKNAEWMCLGLTNFEISIRAEHGLVASRATRGARLEKYINYLFKNIGRCSGLKKLHLEFGFENLFDPLRFSFVDHLSELKQLEQFKILRISNKGGLQEGRWMVKNWPRLASVIVYDLGANRVFEECLRRERPDLELSRYDEFYGGPRIFTT
ncbi:hypothetical protein BGZ76_005815 [Entomortierella beljakovae]|nr:hypothetical protein BGZ76_005815 [Entomortierella beljakovae]